MENILVLVADYPNNSNGVSLMYVHTRNLAYIKNGIDVTVLNFRTKQDYFIDGIKVISLKSYKKSKDKYKILISHAANLRNHFVFLIKFGNKFERFVFFYHGHEVLRINKVYSKPYFYVRDNKIKFFLQDRYDSIKLFLWKKYLPMVKSKSDYIFVSKWMYDEFLYNLKIDSKILEDKCSITYNSVGSEFEFLSYNDKSQKEYDFVTIRANLDGSKYGIDIVNKLANISPDCKFLLIGKGRFFEYYEKASNITWLNQTMSHQEIVKVLNESRYALMPTRTDAQGLMVCEMAAFGIPVITSDIPVCHEVFDGFTNAYFIDNCNIKSLSNFKDKENHTFKDTRFYIQNTIAQELTILKRE